MLVAMLAVAAPARAEFLYRRADLAHLARRAAVIVEGSVVEARYEGHPDYPHVQTVRVTLEVERMLRGPAGRRYTFREFVPGLQLRMGKRDYAVGQRLLLFLPRPSQYGLSSPLGREQGRFRIRRDRQGNDLVENGYGNSGLFRQVAEKAARVGVDLSPRELRVVASKRGPVRLEDFLSLVVRLSLVAEAR